MEGEAAQPCRAVGRAWGGRPREAAPRAEAPCPGGTRLPACQGFAFEARPAPGGGRARLGVLCTPHGEVHTPAFLPVGTQGTVKGCSPAELAAAGSEMILCNSYHLWLRPGPDVVALHGGLHGFSGWQRAILTDSGGFQAMSLHPLCWIDDGGVTFRSHLDGATRRLTPETAMALQEALGADVAMALDQCVAYPCPRGLAEDAVRRTLAWAARCREVHRRQDQALFAIVQGGVHADLARDCARALRATAFAGYAVGSLSVGESLDEMGEALAAVVPELPGDRPRYLMGVGSPDCLVEAVWHGIDLFDCVLPTRIARNGTALVLPAGLCPSETGQELVPEAFPEGRRGRLVVRNAAYARDLRPVDPSCGCAACRHSRAYLRHLCHAGEMLGARLLSLHNLHTLHRLVRTIRAACAEARFAEFRRAFWERALPWRAAGRPPGALAAPQA